MERSLSKTDRRILDGHEMALLSASAINTPDYVRGYVDDLVELFPDKTNRILDTASGTGFPALELLNRGYRNIVACDGDNVALEELRKRLSDHYQSIKVKHCTWDKLPFQLTDQFDVVLNVGHSFAYIDGWTTDQDPSQVTFCSHWSNIRQRFVRTLEGFRGLLKPSGILIIGLAKHYEMQSFDGSFDHPLSCVIQPVSLDGKILNLEWTSDLNWETRTHVWKTKVDSKEVFGEATRKSYLFTKEELAEFMREAGFPRVDIVQTPNARDNFVVGSA